MVVDAGFNRLGGVPVTFTVRQGGGTFGGQETVTTTSDSDGRVAATLTLGLQEGNANNLVEANFPFNTGFGAAFTASGRSPGNGWQTSRPAICPWWPPPEALAGPRQTGGCAAWNPTPGS